VAQTLKLEILRSKVSPEIFHEFCKEAEICPECLTATVTHSREDPREIVCRNCGIVLGNVPVREHTLPGHGTHTWYNDVCNLAFGKSLGSYLGQYQLYSVLAKSAAGKKDLGIRACHIKNVTRIEIPQIQKMLEYGSKLCKDHELSGKDEQSIIFAEFLGRALRHVGTYTLSLSRRSIFSKKLSYATFMWCYEQYFHDGHNLKEELDVNEDVYSWVSWLLANFPLLPGKVEYYTGSAKTRWAKKKIEEIEKKLAQLKVSS